MLTFTLAVILAPSGNFSYPPSLPNQKLASPPPRVRAGGMGAFDGHYLRLSTKVEGWPAFLLHRGGELPWVVLVRGKAGQAPWYAYMHDPAHQLVPRPDTKDLGGFVAKRPGVVTEIFGLDPYVDGKPKPATAPWDAVWVRAGDEPDTVFVYSHNKQVKRGPELEALLATPGNKDVGMFRRMAAYESKIFDSLYASLKEWNRVVGLGGPEAAAKADAAAAEEKRRLDQIARERQAAENKAARERAAAQAEARAKAAAEEQKRKEAERLASEKRTEQARKAAELQELQRKLKEEEARRVEAERKLKEAEGRSAVNAGAAEAQRERLAKIAAPAGMRWVTVNNGNTSWEQAFERVARENKGTFMSYFAFETTPGDARHPGMTYFYEAIARGRRGENWFITTVSDINRRRSANMPFEEVQLLLTTDVPDGNPRQHRLNWVPYGGQVPSNALKVGILGSSGGGEIIYVIRWGDGRHQGYTSGRGTFFLDARPANLLRPEILVVAR